MSHSMLQKHLYNGILEILRDGGSYYNSIMVNSSSLTEKGKDELIQYVLMLAPRMIELYDTQLKEHAKKLVIEGLQQ